MNSLIILSTILFVSELKTPIDPVGGGPELPGWCEQIIAKLAPNDGATKVRLERAAALLLERLDKVTVEGVPYSNFRYIFKGHGFALAFDANPDNYRRSLSVSFGEPERSSGMASELRFVSYDETEKQANYLLATKWGGLTFIFRVSLKAIQSDKVVVTVFYEGSPFELTTTSDTRELNALLQRLGD